ncbi:hypothetical protein DFJ74DRAFT_654736 [Hyaloraphidium curvatum]|nr:hypothetical protein DFJ74DRAFT_654736 [Hyaloraphidium curvatum]
MSVVRLCRIVQRVDRPPLPRTAIMRRLEGFLGDALGADKFAHAKRLELGRFLGDREFDSEGYRAAVGRLLSLCRNASSVSVDGLPGYAVPLLAGMPRLEVLEVANELRDVEEVARHTWRLERLAVRDEKAAEAFGTGPRAIEVRRAKGARSFAVPGLVSLQFSNHAGVGMPAGEMPRLREVDLTGISGVDAGTVNRIAELAPRLERMRVRFTLRDARATAALTDEAVALIDHFEDEHVLVHLEAMLARPAFNPRSVLDYQYSSTTDGATEEKRQLVADMLRRSARIWPLLCARTNLKEVTCWYLPTVLLAGAVPPALEKLTAVVAWPCLGAGELHVAAYNLRRAGVRPVFRGFRVGEALPADVAPPVGEAAVRDEITHWRRGTPNAGNPDYSQGERHAPPPPQDD